MSDNIANLLQQAKEKGIKTVLGVRVNSSFSNINSVSGSSYTKEHKQAIIDWFDWLRIQLPELPRQEIVNRCACLMNDAKVICISSNGYTPSAIVRIINNL